MTAFELTEPEIEMVEFLRACEAGLVAPNGLTTSEITLSFWDGSWHSQTARLTDRSGGIIIAKGVGYTIAEAIHNLDVDWEDEGDDETE
jgi:hypothetical protein